MAQLRLGILPLAIETGRFNQTPANERFCYFCKTEVEDEFHFICKCNLYNDIRNNLIMYMMDFFTGFILLNEEEKFKIIMKTNNRELHKYVNNAWEIRKLYLYNRK